MFLKEIKALLGKYGLLPGDHVLVWREKQEDNCIGEWVSPITITAVEEEKKQVFLHDYRIGQSRPFNMAQRKHYLQPEKLSSTFMSDLRSGFRYFVSPEHGDFYLTEVIPNNDGRG